MPQRLVTFALLLAACGGSSPTLDASAPRDAPDAPDAAPDATADHADAGLDAGPPPPGPGVPVPCDDTLDDVYVAPADLPPGTLEDRGEIVRCAREGWLSPFELGARLARGGVAGIAATTGAHAFRVAYRTTRRGDVPALGTAWVLIPDAPRVTPSPLAVAAHGTAGIADACAPSRHAAAGDSLVVPWAARGWPVIAPDYAGLGNEGIQGYGDNDDTARSVLDAARALRALLPAGTLTEEIVIAGHSQGGGAVLSAQALEASYGAGGRLALVIPFAPGWPVRRDASGYRFPGVPTSFGGGAPAAIASIFLYAWHARAYGDARAGEGFAEASRAEVVRALERDCIYTLATTIPAAAPTFGTLVDETFRAGILSCESGAACSGPAAEHWAFLEDNILHGDPDGAPILAFAGTTDTLATPSDVACIVRHLETDGVSPRVCVDASSHFDIVPRHAALAVDYAEALLSSADPPDCPSPSVSLPVCPE